MKLTPFDEYAQANGVTVTDSLQVKEVQSDLTPMLKKQFLKFFSSCGLLDEAANSVGLNRATVLDWHYEDEQFRDNFDRIRDSLEVLVFDSLMQRVISGKSDNAAMFILKSLNPKKYDDKARTPQEAPKISITMVDAQGEKLVDTSDAPKLLPLTLEGELIGKKE